MLLSRKTKEALERHEKICDEIATERLNGGSKEKCVFHDPPCKDGKCSERDAQLKLQFKQR